MVQTKKKCKMGFFVFCVGFIVASKKVLKSHHIFLIWYVNGVKRWGFDKQNGEKRKGFRKKKKEESRMVVSTKIVTIKKKREGIWIWCFDFKAAVKLRGILSLHHQFQSAKADLHWTITRSKRFPAISKGTLTSRRNIAGDGGQRNRPFSLFLSLF